MTVSYNLDVSQTSIWGFIRLQLRWRGSIWKCVLVELLVFCLLFLTISFAYHTEGIISDSTRKFIDNFSALFDAKMEYIPLTFMVGFFVVTVVNRWHNIFYNMGWIDNIAFTLGTYLRGTDEKSRILRRNTIRYMVLMQVLVYRDISMKVRKRFPTLETVVAAGVMSAEELKSIVDCTAKYSKSYLPVQWAFLILYEARASGKIAADLQLNEIMKHIMEFRQNLANLIHYDWVPIPLAYPQVVFLAVRMYFLLALIARQSVLIDGKSPEPAHVAFPLVPFLMTVLQFIFYVGWMKVAESMMNPLGEDDDDFECNYVIDRNLQFGLTIVDDNYNVVPPQVRDVFWSEKMAEPLYSAETANMTICPQIGSVAQIEPTNDEVVMMNRECVDMENQLEVDCGNEEQRLLPRVVSVVSVNRDVAGSRLSLNSRKGHGILDALKNRFTSRDRLMRPGHTSQMMSSQTSLSPPMELQNAYDHVVDEELDIGMTDATADSPRQSYSGIVLDPLTSVPEEDEDAQRTRTSNDLRRWLNEAKMDKKDETGI